MQNFRRLIPALNYRNSLLQALCAKASEEEELLKSIRLVLPDDLRPHVQNCVVSPKSLTVFTRSANWATALRFHGQTMLDAVNKKHSSVLSAIRIKVLPEFPVKKSRRKPILPSPDTVSVLMAQSQTVGDPQLKASLLRLGDTLSRLQQGK